MGLVKEALGFMEQNRKKKRRKLYIQMKLDRKNKHLTPNKYIRKHGKDILNSDNFISSGNNIQHGNMSVRKHSIQVAKYSLMIAKKLNIRCDRRKLIRGALLHDYFLYDWHAPEHVGITNLHGFFHPGIALRNAEKEYHLSAKEKDIIKKHMWPLTVVPPACPEAWIVTIADKYCSLMETFHVHKGSSVVKPKEKKEKPLLLRIMKAG